MRSAPAWLGGPAAGIIWCMNPAGSKEELRAWKARWKMVNDFELEELRRTPMSEKSRALAVLMNTAHQLGWQPSTEAEIEEVRNRWIRLKRIALGT